MADLFTVGTSSDFAVKLWSKRLYMDSIHGEGLISDMIGDGILMEDKDLSKGAGDRVRIHYNQRLSKKGVIGDGAVRPNAKDLAYFTDDVLINKLSQPTKVKADGSMAQQRTSFDLKAAQYPVMADWFKQRMIAGAFNQLGGNTATSLSFDGLTYTGDERLEITGMQTPTAPSTNRVIYADPSNNNSDNDVNTGTDRMKLALIDDAVDLALDQVGGVNNFLPIIGKPYKFKLYIGHKGFNDLLQEAQSSGNITLGQLELNRVSSGTGQTYLGDFFDYNYTRVVRVPEFYIPVGNNSGTALTNVKRALFVGRDAGCLAFGKGYESNGDTIPGFNIVEDLDPIEEEIVGKVTGIFGVKKAVVNSEDQSVITISHYVG